MRRRELLGLAGGMAATLAGSVTPARAQTTIRTIGFGGISNLPIWVAQSRGLFAREGFAVDDTDTPGSIKQFRDIMGGNCEIVVTAIDNIVAYTEGQADIQLDHMDVFAFMGGDTGLNFLVVRPEIKQFSDIAGKTVVVDALTTGYAFLLFRILENHGLNVHQDYDVIGIGEGGRRLDAMVGGRAVAAVMSAAQVRRALALGFNVLATPAQALGGKYQSSVYATRRSWAKDHGAILVGMVRAIRAANEYIFSDRAGAMQIMAGRLTGLSPADAAATFDSLIDPGGLIRSAAIDVDGVRTVLSMRNEFAVPHKQLTDPYKYLDLAYYRRAITPLSE